MYEEHFGLERSPFRAKAIGSDVFVGPQTASTMAGFRKALTSQDAVVTVSGLVGTGKTTLVERAVDAMGTKYKTIRVGRMAMNSSDVLEALLVVLGVQDRPAGTIQRFAALRKKLKELQDRDVRVFILVEDALRAGVETLAELEALTAADAGESDGASIVLMGDERLGEFMQSPELGQLQQRIRQRHTIYPQCGAEMRAYLMHCFRQVGGDFEHIFDARAVALLKELSGGIARIANNLVESSLAAAAAKGLDRIPSTLIAEVAADEYGLNADDFDFAMPVAEDPVALDSAQADVEPTADDAPAREADHAVESEPETAAANVAADAVDSVDDNRNSTHHTLPDLEILSPDYAALAMGDVDDRPETADVTEPESVADVVSEPEPQALSELMPEPDPEAIAALMPEPEPVSVAEVVSEPEPVPVAEDIPLLDPVAIAEIVAEPDAEIIAELMPEPKPEAIAELTPAPEPEAIAEIMPAPGPEAIAETLPGPEPEAIAEIMPAPVPVQDEGDEVAPQLLPDPVEVVVADIDPMDAPELEVTGNMASEFVSVPEPDQAETSIPEPIAAIAAEPLAEDIPELVPELLPEPLAEHISDLLSEPGPQAVADDIPELVTEPEPFADLLPELMPEPAPEPVAENIPALLADSESVPILENTDLPDSPEWEQEPTLAELKPDLEALEQAMAFAKGGSAHKADDAPVEGGSLYDRVTICEEIPEITLDKTIETGIENMQAGTAEDDRPMTPLKKSAVELDKVAAEIGMASTLEDFDDKMAETLFGTGISMIAAQLTIKQPTQEPANDEIQLELDEAASATPSVDDEPSAAPPVNSLSEEVVLETTTPANSGVILPTATQRLKTVRALNAKPAVPSRETKPTQGVGPEGSGTPAPIEDQIKTSITQTVKALEIPADLEDDEPEEKRKRGFFSRFRRS